MLVGSPQCCRWTRLPVVRLPALQGHLRADRLLLSLPVDQLGLQPADLMYPEEEHFPEPLQVAPMLG